MDQIYFKIVLEMCEIKSSEYDKIMNMNDNLRQKTLEKKQYSKTLLCIDSGRVIIFDVKKKDEINLT